MIRHSQGLGRTLIILVVCTCVLAAGILASEEDFRTSASIGKISDKAQVELLISVLSDALNRPNAFNLDMLAQTVLDSSKESIKSTVTSIAGGGDGKTALGSGAANQQISLSFNEMDEAGDSLAVNALVHVNIAGYVERLPVEIRIERRGRALFFKNLPDILDNIDRFAADYRTQLVKDVGKKALSQPIKTLEVQDIHDDNLLKPKAIWQSSTVFNATLSRSQFDGEIFSRPYGIGCMIYDDPGDDLDLNQLVITDANWDRIIASDEGDPNSSTDGYIVSRGHHGTDSLGFCNPTGLASLGQRWIVADGYNNRAQVFVLADNILHYSCDIVGDIDNAIDVAAAVIIPDWDDPNSDYAEVALLDWGNSNVKLAQSVDCSLKGTVFTAGSGPSQLSHPTSISYGRHRVNHYNIHWVYVADAGNKRVVLKNLDYPYQVLSTPVDMFPDNAYLTSVTVDFFGNPIVVDHNNSMVYLLSPDLSEVLATFGSEGMDATDLYFPNRLKVAEGIRYIENEPRMEPLAVGDAFVTELFGASTGIKRYVLKGSVTWGGFEYQPKQFDNPYCRDYLYLPWYQTGTTRSRRVVSYFNDELELVCDTDIHEVDLPGQNHLAYDLIDAPTVPTLFVDIAIRSFYTNELIDSFHIDTTLERYIDTTCSAGLNFVCNDTSVESLSSLTNCVQIVDLARPLSSQSCVYGAPDKWWALVAPQLTAYDTTHCSPKYRWTYNTFYADTLLSEGTDHLVTSQDTVYIKIPEPVYQFPMPQTLLAKVKLANTIDTLISPDGPFMDSVDVYAYVYGSYCATACATACTTCYVPSCPMLYVYDGEKYDLCNNILPQSESGDSLTFSRLDIVPLLFEPPNIDGRYRLRIAEDENEVSYLNRVQLISFDIPNSAENLRLTTGQGLVAIGDQAAYLTSALLSTGEDVTDKLRFEDGYKLTSSSPGYVDLIYKTPAAKTNSALRPLTSDDGGTLIEEPPKDQLSKPLADPDAPLIGNIYTLSAMNETGEYEQVERRFPRMRRTRMLTELSDHMIDGVLKVRLSWSQAAELDYLPYLTFQRLTPTIAMVPLVNASHSADGAVTTSLNHLFSEPVLLSPGQKIDLEFQAEPPPDSLRRVFMFVARGRYERVGSALPTTTEELPEDFTFEQNYPNPFNPETTFRFGLPSASHVTLEIYNILGKKVRTLVDGEMPAGRHVLSWDGNSSEGSQVASGVYFARLTAGSYTSTKKMVVVK